MSIPHSATSSASIGDGADPVPSESSRTFEVSPPYAIFAHNGEKTIFDDPTPKGIEFDWSESEVREQDGLVVVSLSGVIDVPGIRDKFHGVAIDLPLGVPRGIYAVELPDRTISVHAERVASTPAGHTVVVGVASAWHAATSLAPLLKDAPAP